MLLCKKSVKTQRFSSSLKKTCSCDSSIPVEGNPMSLGKKTLHPKRKSQQILYPKTDLQNQNMNQSRGNQRL